MEAKYFRMMNCVRTEIKMKVRCQRTQRSALKISQAPVNFFVLSVADRFGLYPVKWEYGKEVHI